MEELALEVIERGSAVHCVSAYEGDIIVLGSDGVFDNLYLEEVDRALKHGRFADFFETEDRESHRNSIKKKRCICIICGIYIYSKIVMLIYLNDIYK